jgi:hypothetical protein
VPNQSRRGRLGGDPTGADADHPFIGLDHVPVARDEIHPLLIHRHHGGLEPPQVLVGPPVPGELGCRTGEVAVVTFELFLQPLREAQGVGGGPGEPDNDLVVVNAPHFFGAVLDHAGVQRDLAVAGNRRPTLVPDGQNGRTVIRHDRLTARVHRIFRPALFRS